MVDGEVVERFAGLVKGLLVSALVFTGVGFIASVVGVYGFINKWWGLAATGLYVAVMSIVYVLGVVSFVESFIGWRVWVGVFCGASAFVVFTVSVLLANSLLFVWSEHIIKTGFTAVGFMGMVLGLSGMYRLWSMFVDTGRGERG